MGKALTGILARAKGPTQKFPALLSPYYVPGGADPVLRDPKTTQFWKHSLRGKYKKKKITKPSIKADNQNEKRSHS